MKNWLRSAVIVFVNLLILPLVAQDLQVSSDGQDACSGRVITKQGAGIYNASIILYENSFNPNTFELKRRIIQQTSSQEDGAFTVHIPSFPADTFNMYTVIAVAQGYSLGWKNWKSQNSNMDITLGEYGSISGLVVDSTQKPIQNAEIRLLLVSRQDENAPFSDVFDWITTKSNEDGTFLFSFIPMDAKAEFVIKADRKTTFSTLFDSPYDEPQYAVNQKDIVIAVPGESVITGKCIDQETNKPVSGIQIYLQFKEGLPFVPDLNQITTSDENGAFQFNRLSKGAYRIYLSSNPKDTAEWVAPPVEVELVSEDVKELDIHLSKGALYTVNVTDAKTSVKIKNVHVSIIKSLGSSIWGYTGQTDQNGSCRIRVYPNQYDLVQIQREGYKTVELKQLKDIKLGDTQHLDIQLDELPRINGTVFDRTRKKANDIKVSIYATGYESISNDAGQYEIQYGSAPEDILNSYLIGVDSERHLMGIKRIEDINESCDLYLSNTIALSGTIVDPNNSYVPNAVVSINLLVEGESIFIGVYPTDMTGKFTVPQILPDHKYQLLVSTENYGTTNKIVHVAQIQSDNYNLDPIKIGTVEIQGYVVDESKRPVEGVLVDIYNTYKNKRSFLGLDIQLAGSGYSDSEGKYQIEIHHPLSGVDTQFAILHKDTYALKVAQYQSKRYEFDQVMLTEKYTQYSGYVKDTHGNPITGATVFAFVDDLGWSVINLIYETALTRWLHTQTDENGYFEFTHIPSIAKAEFGAIADGYVNAFSWTTEKQINPSIPAGKGGIDIVMQRPGTISGKIIEKESLHPIPNETVYLFRLTPSRDFSYMYFDAYTGEITLPYSLQNDSWEFVTDKEGLFTAYNLTPGDYGLSVYSYIHPNRKWSSLKRIVSVPEGTVVQTALEAIKAGKVSIQVVRKDNLSPMEDVVVRIIPQIVNENYVQNLAEFKTDSTGSVNLHLSPGKYVIDGLIKKDYVALNLESSSFIVESDVNLTVPLSLGHFEC